MKERNGSLSEQTARALLDLLAPGSKLISVTVPDGSFSNYTHIVTSQLMDGSPWRVVVRRYKIFGDYDRGEKAHREFRTFKLLHRHHVPAPAALYLDETGEVLEIPGIVTSFVEGRLMLDAPSNPLDWARKLARTLVRIHSIPCGQEEQRFLLRGNAEVTWFFKYDGPPRYMMDYPGGTDLWHTLRRLFPKIQTLEPVLLHIDYWSGNILWHEDEISAVIDWEEAAHGDPAVDVAYARMNMVLMGLPDAADEFTRIYELETGRALRNLGFWELAAAVRPMTDPEDWKINQTPGMDRLKKFVGDARKKT